MPQVVTEDFLKSLRSSPSGKRKNGTEFDELYTSLETTDKPLDNVIRTVSEFHGPWNGGSVELADFTSFMASRLKTGEMRTSAQQNVIKAIDVTNESNSGNYNQTTFAVMPTPMLREFINRSQKLHPSVNMYLQMHSGSFPYYQQTSENVGSYTAINMNRTSIDPMKWPNAGGNRCLSTNARIDFNTAQKMAGYLLSLMENSNNMTNSMMLRAMPKQNNMSFVHPNYSQESPIPHGHSFAMDVHNAEREKKAISPCLSAIVNLAGDLLRLLNRFFCLNLLARYSVEDFDITFNEGPNGEPVTVVMDNTGKQMHDNEQGNDVTDPTNDEVLGTKEEYKKEVNS